MRFVASTGSPCPAEVKRAMIEWWGPVLHESYAASEFGYVTAISSHEAAAQARLRGQAQRATRSSESSTTTGASCRKARWA